MATYKLIQDIEAEDHILGPLTLRQFIYGLVAALLYYICFIIFTKHIWVLLILFLPPAFFATFFAFPFKRDQPTEVWALSKLRFLLKPKRRIWSQSGFKDLVTITVPKKVEHPLTNGLSQTEVRSRLQALAMTLDTRGWAVKNIGEVPNEPTITITPDSDRLFGIGSIPQPLPDFVESPNDDMLDDMNPKSLQIEDLINESTEQNRRQLIGRLDGLRQPESKTTESLDGNDQELTNTLKANVKRSNLSTSSLHTINPTPATKPKISTNKKSVTHIDPAKLSYALNNPSLSIQTVANEINRPDEVVIKLSH